MQNDELRQRLAPTPLGGIEPHSGLLQMPLEHQQLFKIVSVENLLRSVRSGYLHFNRVDRYSDLPNADIHDGEQLPKDRSGNAITRFAKAPNFSTEDYYDQSRQRTYACCFSLENSEFLWTNYANGNPHGKVCVVFDFGKLRAKINRELGPEGARMIYHGVSCHQIFSVNYGLIEYVDWNQHQANAPCLQNPIRYTYLKSRRFSEEREFRISLSAAGFGQFVLNNGETIDFPPALQLKFDFRAAIEDLTIQSILYGSDCDIQFLRSELNQERIVPMETSPIRG